LLQLRLVSDPGRTLQLFWLAALLSKTVSKKLACCCCDADPKPLLPPAATTLVDASSPDSNT
jgi:hypothetical protein